MLSYSFVGSRETLAEKLTSFAGVTGVDEIMIATHMFDANAKLRSLELAASLFRTNRMEALV
jgi:alkanesulfonate monooxygenase SsuD/methylene tetrahydromethanopterin reductase-like flavin-dependent oxidoreductase (luciferase family)